MKKFILLVLAVILLMPIMSLKAASISRLDVTGPDSAGVGDHLTYRFILIFQVLIKIH